jgi:hypothetical protein
MGMSDSCHFSVNLAMELHVELYFWMQRVHAPRKLASRVDHWTCGVAEALSIASRCKSERERWLARDRLVRCHEHIAALHREGFMTPLLYAWAKKQMAAIEDAIVNWEPLRFEKPMEPKAKRPLDLIH